jgi:MarC family membrane protein
MLVTLALGHGLLDVLNISAGDFSTAGGVIIFVIALKMVLGPSSAGDSTARFKSREEERGFGIVPLAMPLLAGPGVISALIVYAGKGPSGKGNTPMDYVILVMIILAVGLATGLALRAAAPLQRLLGQIGIEVATRISGILVAAIAVGMITQGMQDSFPLLVHG